MRDFLINENTIWKDQESKDKFLSKQKKVTNEFWINFLGFFALYSKYKDENRLTQYFRQSTVRLEKVTDTDNDLMVIMKVIDDMHVIPDMVMTKITKLLAKIKTGSLGGLDENLFRTEILKKIKITQLYPYPQISALVKEFNKGNKTLADMLPDIYALAMQHKRGHEFRVMYKRLSHVDDGTASSTQTPNPTQHQSVSPVKSALTGAPKPDPIPVRTQVIPDPTPVVRALTWDDILAHLGSTGMAPNQPNQLLSLMYIVDNCKTEVDISNFFAAFRINPVYGKNLLFADAGNIGALVHGAIDPTIKSIFPDIEKLYKPVNGDLSRFNSAFLDWIKASTGPLYYFNNFVFFNNMDAKENFAYIPMGFAKLNNLIEGGFNTLQNAGITAALITQVTDVIRKLLIDSYMDMPAIFIDALDKSSAMKGNIIEFAFENVYIKLFENISDSIISDMSGSLFKTMISNTNEDLKKLAARFIMLSNTNAAAYSWAQSNISLKDVIEDSGITTNLLLKIIVKDYDEFYKTHLVAEGLGFKEYIEKYGLKYEDFIAEMKTKPDNIEKVLLFANYIYKDYKVSYSYLITDLVFYATDINWLNRYAYSHKENFGTDVLYLFLSENKMTEFNNFLIIFTKWAETTGANRFRSYDFSNNRNYGKMLKEKLSDQSLEYRNLIKLTNILTGESFGVDQFREFNIKPKFIYDNIDLFSNMRYGGLWDIFDYICSDPTIDISKNPTLDTTMLNYLTDRIAEGHSYIGTLGLNKISLMSYKDKILDTFSNMNFTEYSTHIVKGLEYLLTEGIITQEYVTNFYASAIETQDTLFSAIDDITRSTNNEKLQKMSVINLLDTKEKIKDYLKSSGRNKDSLYVIDREFKYKNKSTEYVASYLENNSFWIGKLYEDHGTDALVEYLADPVIKGIWDGVTSGKRLLNNANSLELILLDMLSDASKLKDIDKVLAAFPEKIERTLINTLKEQILIYPLLNDIYESDNPLKPHTKLTPARIKTLLKFNNFEFKGALIRKKKNEPWSNYFGRLSKDFKAAALIPDIKIVKIKDTKDQLNEKTVEYSKYYNGMHGDSAVEFLESYDVSMKYPAYEEFKSRFGENNLIPAFHGSGLTASNFILRFGFTVIPATDSSTVGRMLDIRGMKLAKLKTDGDPIENSNDYVEYLESGYFPYDSVQYNGSPLIDRDNIDNYWTRKINTVGGIYVSDVIEKVAQYLGDEGYSRRTGTIGTIYECEVNLGTKGLHYHSAGTGNDHIRSPEYALCWPQGQINIVKAHKVRFTTKSFVNKLKKKYPTAVQENKYFPKFADYLREQEVIKSKNVITFVFHQGLIPTGKEMIEWTDFEKKVIKKSTKMYLDSNQYGIGVVFNTDKELNGVVRVPFTDEFIVKDPEGLYSQFLNLLDECKG